MCGINGIVRLTPDSSPIDPREVDRTRDAMVARGPDDGGTWLSPGREVALANRRLAILDLSPTGHQPMATADGRFHLVINGEIYNFRALRRELENDGVTFRGTGDTEVVLHLLARHGASSLHRLRGMFALAFWDDREKTLLLARDPLGIKPLYYSADAERTGLLRFASQVKALERGGGVDLSVDDRAVAGFLLWGSVPEPLTIRSSLRSLRAGQVLRLHRGALSFDEIAPPPEAREDEAHDPRSGGRPPHASALKRSVQCHLESDVPIAVFLSAGLDSSLIAALAVEESGPITTLTVTFDDLAGTPDDEGPLAARTAAALGTTHLERRLGREDLENLWGEGLEAMDQPSIDGFNVYAVSRIAAREGFKVVLSGLGGDELFGSYPSFVDVPRWARIGRLGGSIPGLARAWRSLFAGSSRPKLSGLFTWGRSPAGAYALRRGLFLPEELPALLGRRHVLQDLGYDHLAEAREVQRRSAEHWPADSWRLVHELETSLYMRNQLLRDADWASMAHSVELRVPLVDAWLLRDLERMDFEPARTRGKAFTVSTTAPTVPPEVLERAKSGFFVPISRHLRPSSTLPAASAPSKGSQSRLVALEVLRGFGVALPP